MKVTIKNTLLASCLLYFLTFFIPTATAQTGFDSGLDFNKTSHNFGKISVNAGKQECSFDFTNNSGKPVVIFNVISSCGCAEPTWPKEPIMPGKGGKISVTYLNDQGPYPFEKTITVYTSASKKPVLLRISGIAYDKERSVKDLFPIANGPLGFTKREIRLGQIEQGFVKSASVSVANISNKEISLSFANTSAGLFIKASPSKIAAGEIAEITYTVNTNEKENWGNTIYSADILCNGVKTPKKFEVTALIIDKFSTLSKEEKNRSAMILAKSSSISIGNVSKGTAIEGSFSLRNTGASELIIRKAETNGKDFTIIYPQRVKAGEEFKVIAKIDSSKYSGEEVFTITLVTNSANRPLVNLFVAANIN
ncbi:MAG: DUF1573 domain-containing protein [Bacteroidales bacterium]|nr:DUF1573 domain-containing protein [Bacteroidales bacterium]